MLLSCDKKAKRRVDMKRCALVFAFVLSLGIIFPNVSHATSENIGNINSQIEKLKEQINLLQKEVSQLQHKLSLMKQQSAKNKSKEVKENLSTLNKISSFIKENHIGIGVSSGYFYANNTGESNKDKFMITNFLLTWDFTPSEIPFSFSTGIGGTATPSLLDNPYDSDAEPDIDIEYADFTLGPEKDSPLSLEVGLLQPNAGYEDTYTFNNKNITVGVLASQQPYNAYGARLNYSFSDSLNIYAGYYKDRKDSDEYVVDYDGKEFKGENAWEAGISGNLFNVDYTLYYYQLNNFRKLLGITLDKTFDNLYAALDVDYWNWDKRLSDYYGSKSSIGGALYISPTFGKFEFPLRLEYIHQGKSKIYIDNTDTDNIFAVTLTPTYHLTKNAYIRAEGSYIHAKDGFSNNSGNIKDNRYYLSSEVGLVF